MDRRFVQAFTEPARVRILGRLVYPFCLKHRLQLVALGSPFMEEGNPTITTTDLLLAVKVCAEEPIEATWKDTWQGFKMIRSKDYMNQEGAKLLAHMSSVNWPKFWEKTEHAGNTTGTPWVLSVVCNLVKNGVPMEQAWNMPEAQAIWLSTGFITNEPGSAVKVLTTEEEELLDQAARVEPTDGQKT